MKLAFIRSFTPQIFMMIPVLFIASKNLREVPITQMGIAVFTAIVISTLAVLFLRLIIKNYQLANTIISSLIIALFLFGPLQIKLPLVLSLSLVTVFFITTCYYCCTRPNFLNHYSSLLANIGIMMLALCFINMVLHPSFKHKLLRKYQNQTRIFQAQQIPNTPSSANSELDFSNKTLSHNPDVYFIILDGYARFDTLKTFYNFDNSNFISELEQLGFFVAKNSSSNYPMTHTSLASSLNMEYINDLIATYGSKDFEPYFQAIKNAKVPKLFKQLGYKYVTLSSGWGPTQLASTDSDIHYNRKLNSLPNYYQKILEMTPLKSIVENSEAKLRLYVLHKLENLPKEQPSSKFVFCHLILPHPPFLFSSDGKIMPHVTNNYSDKDLYLGQLQYTNHRITALVKKLIASSKTPPIIILQADHGSESTLEHYKDGPLNKDQVLERFSILNAIYAPLELKQQLTNDISSVNTFRYVFNHLVKEDLPILENQQFFKWYFDSEFYNVTSEYRALN